MTDIAVTDKPIRERAANMDLERVLLIFMVIVLHLNNRDMGGALTQLSAGPGTEIFLRLTQSLSICAVDAFIMLSGYFSSGDRSGIAWAKAARLLFACSFYRVTGYVLYVLWISHDFSLRTLIGYIIPNNWFVCLFVTLLVLMPFINRIEKPPVGLPAVLFSVIPTLVSFSADLAHVDISGLSTVTWQGDAGGFNIALFILCYCLGWAIREHRDYFDRFHACLYLTGFILLGCLTAALSVLTESAWNYSCVTVVAEALMLTLCFTRIRIGGRLTGRVLSGIAGCAFGIFIWHTMPLMIFGLWVHFDIPDAYAQGGGRMLGMFAAAALCMYALSFVWVYICRLCFTAIRGMIYGADKTQKTNT